MLLEKFSNIIDRTPIGAAIDYRRKLIEQTDPQRIYVENIRSFFHIPHGLAKWLCEVAVKEGAFEKRIGFLCPNCQALIGHIKPSESAPQLFCESCKTIGEDKYEFSKSECQVIAFYRLV